MVVEGHVVHLHLHVHGEGYGHRHVHVGDGHVHVHVHVHGYLHRDWVLRRNHGVYGNLTLLLRHRGWFFGVLGDRREIEEEKRS